MMLKSQSRMQNTVLTIAGLLIILAWMRYAQDLIVPFLLALFLAAIAATPVNWLKNKGLPVPLAVILVLLISIALGVFVALILGSSVNEFSQSLPAYQTRLQELTIGVIDWLAGLGIEAPESGGILNVIDPGQAMGFANSLISSLGGVFGNAFLILFTVLFMLLEAWSFPQKINAIYGNRGGEVLSRVSDVISSTRQYLSIKALMSLATGRGRHCGDWTRFPDTVGIPRLRSELHSQYRLDHRRCSRSTAVAGSAWRYSNHGGHPCLPHCQYRDRQYR